MCKMETKQELRRKFKACGATLTNEYRDFADCAIRAFVQYSEVWQRAESVFVYVSMWAEPDTRALIDAALAAGKRVYVPLCCPDRTMKAVRIRSLDELRPGTLNIPEPPEENETAAPGELDLAVVPCVTATADGARLGHGAGYYDRFLPHCTRARVTAVAFEAQRLARVAFDETDRRMDRIVTEETIYTIP